MVGTCKWCVKSILFGVICVGTRYLGVFETSCLEVGLKDLHLTWFNEFLIFGLNWRQCLHR
jgi:hypothetical protein